MSELSQRLGFAPEDRVVIVNADGLGCSHATNAGVFEALRDGLVTSATIQIPCPWSRQAAANYRGEDVGVQLTLNSPYDLYRWGPIIHAPSLLDGNGGFPRTVDDLWEHADMEEVRRELRAQVERAILWGFDVSHLDSYLGALHLRPEFFDVYLDLAIEFALPIRLRDPEAERSIGFPFRTLAKDEGVLSPDHYLHVSGIGARHAIERAIPDLEVGVTELQVHPAADTPELRAYSPEWAAQVDDLHLVTHDRQLPAMLKRLGVHLIGYRELREAQRLARS